MSTEPELPQTWDAYTWRCSVDGSCVAGKQPGSYPSSAGSPRGCKSWQERWWGQVESQHVHQIRAGRPVSHGHHADRVDTYQIKILSDLMVIAPCTGQQPGSCPSSARSPRGCESWQRWGLGQVALQEACQVGDGCSRHAGPRLQESQQEQATRACQPRWAVAVLRSLTLNPEQGPGALPYLGVGQQACSPGNSSFF